MKNEGELSIPKSKTLFNSKLFFDLDNTSNDTEAYESDNSDDYETNDNEINNNYYLSKDLLKRLDSSYPTIQEESNNNLDLNLFNIDNFTPFNNNNFELLLNDYILYKNLNKISIYDNINKVEKKKTFQERKGDWICFVCNNLNFAFRTRCNICGSNKEESAKIII